LSYPANRQAQTDRQTDIQTNGGQNGSLLPPKVAEVM